MCLCNNIHRGEGYSLLGNYWMCCGRFIFSYNKYGMATNNLSCTVWVLTIDYWHIILKLQMSSIEHAMIHVSESETCLMTLTGWWHLLLDDTYWLMSRLSKLNISGGGVPASERLINIVIVWWIRHTIAKGGWSLRRDGYQPRVAIISFHLSACVVTPLDVVVLDVT